MKKVISVISFVLLAFSFNANASSIDGFRITPNVGASFITGEPESSIGGNIGIDAGIIKKLDEKSELEFGFGFSFLTPVNYAQSGANGLSATSVNNTAIDNIEGSSVPLYVKLGYTKYLNESNFITTALKLGYNNATGGDRDYVAYSGTIAGDDFTEKEQNFDTEGGLYLGASVGYGFSNFVVSLDYQMIGAKVQEGLEVEEMNIEVPGSGYFRSVSTTNHVVGLNLAYRFNM